MTRKAIHLKTLSLCLFVCLLLNALDGFNQTYFGERETITDEVTNPISVYSIDLDNDGDLDIVSGSNEDNKIAWYENDGNGNFGTQQILSNYLTHLKRFYPIDKDCDGDMDFFAEFGDQNYPTYGWLRNNNDFSSQWNVEISNNQNVFGQLNINFYDNYGFRFFNVSDYNDDGTSDFYNPYFYAKGNCDWNSFDSIVENPIDLGVYFTRIWHEDLDNDGSSDYIVGGWNHYYQNSAQSSLIFFKKNLGNGLYEDWEQISLNITNCNYIAIGDVDADNNNDIVSINYEADQVNIHYGNGSNSFSNTDMIWNTIDRPNWVFCEDLDNDGDDDIIVAGYMDIIWIESLGGGNFAEAVTIDQFSDEIGVNWLIYDPTYFLFEDYDVDGDLDIVFADYNSDKIFYYENYQLNVDNQPMDTSVCPGETLVLSIESETAESFQWHVNNGAGFSPVEDNAQYSGAQTDSLNIINAGETLSGNLYFCEISVSAGSTVSDTITLFVGDTIPPEILSSPSNQEIGDATSCEAFLPDYTSLVDFTDNCDPSPSIIQTPPAGTEINGAINSINFTISDISGNTSEVNINVAVSDTTDPVIASGPLDQNISALENCNYIMPDFSGELSVSDNCDTDLEITQNPAADTEISDEITSVHFTVTDDMGNSSFYTFTLTKVDDSAPVFISNPDDQILIADNNCQTTLPDYIAMCTIQDNCDNDPIVQQIPPAGSIVSGATNTVQILTEDEAGNTNSISFNAEVQDTTAPLITSILNDMIIGDSIACTVNLPDYTSLLNGYDNCDDPLNKQQQPLPGTPVSGLDNTVVLSLSDNSGNFSQIAFNVSVADTTAPEFLTSIADQDIIASGNCDYIITDFTDDVFFSDLCDANPIISQIPEAGTISDAESQLVQLLLEDESGNQNLHSFYLNLQDTTRPEIQYAPENQTHYLNALCEFAVPDFTDSVQAIDNCDNTLSIVQTPPAGTIVSTNEVDILIQVTDDFGNQENADFTITLLDTIAPAFANILHDTIIGDAINCEHVLPDFTSLLGISDNCDSNPQISQNPIAGTLVSGVDNEITITLSDESDNFSSMQFNVAVMDTSAPEILNTPDLQTVYADLNCQYIMPDYSELLQATDNCSDTIFITQSPAAGELISEVMSEVILYATDDSDNTDQVSFNVQMIDTIRPEFVNPLGEQFIGNGIACEAILPDYTRQIDFHDNCDDEPVIYQSPEAGSIIGGDTTLVHLTLIDASGNNTSISFNVTVLDLVAPELSNVPDQMDFYADSNCLFILPNFSSEVGITDNCDENPTLHQIPEAGSEISGSVNSIILIGSDVNGNETSASFNLNVIDSIAPELICSDTISLNLTGNQTYYQVQGNEIDPIYFDNCPIVDLTNDINHFESLEGDIFTIGKHEIHWAATDASYNETQCRSLLIINRPEGMLLPHSIAIYPNPNHGIFTIDFAGNQVEKLEIFNAIGQRVLETTPRHDEEIIDISVFSSGMYIVRIHLPNDIVTDEIIVE